MPNKTELKDQVKLSVEGYKLSSRYSRSPIKLHLRQEGIEQKKFYIKKLTELLAALCREN